jgi:hypothetical protein
MIKTNVILGNDYDNPNWNEANRFRGTYLHGDIERDMGYDIFCFTEKLELTGGIHLLEINNIPCTFFIWESIEFPIRSEWRGFLIYTSDLESYVYCKECFDDKQELL